MPLAQTTTTREGRDLVLTSLIDAQREKVFRAWTEPELIKQWFAPRPRRCSGATPKHRLDRFNGSSALVLEPARADSSARAVARDQIPFGGTLLVRLDHHAP